MKTQRNRDNLEYIHEHESSTTEEKQAVQEEQRKAATRSHTYKCLNHNPLTNDSKRIHQQLNPNPNPSLSPSLSLDRSGNS